MAKLKILLGSPCSGKSTYAREHMGENDLIFDYDDLAAAITCNDGRAENRNQAHRVIQGWRYTLCNIIRDGECEADTVWMPITNISDSFRQKLDEIGAEVIEMETTEAECLERLCKDKNRPDKERWADLIRAWYASRVRCMADSTGEVKIELREDSAVIEGYVNAVERDSKVLPPSMSGKESDVPFVERIKAGAFGNALHRDANVKFMLNHERVIESPIKLEEDVIGLHARATVTDPELLGYARSGALTGWSFGFYVRRCEWDMDAQPPRRDIYDLTLDEVSILTKTPAYIATTVEVRSAPDQPERDENERGTVPLEILTTYIDFLEA